jgi:hypothetical protein
MRTVYKYVAIVALDGMGNFNLKTPTPCMDKIFENGAVTYYGLSMSPTASTENWPTMFMGVAPEVHAVLNEVENGRVNKGDRFPTIFKRVRDAIPDARISSFASWKTINTYMIEPDIGVNFYTAPDKDLLEPIIEEVANRPNLFFVYFEDIDSAEEFIIRDDSPFPDTGYPGITLLDDHHVMVVYYIEDPAFPTARGIEGNIIEF